MENPEEATSSEEETNRLENQSEVTSSNGKRKRIHLTQEEASNPKGVKSRRYVKMPWSEKEVKAVTKHFRPHISKGHLASKLECEQCKLAEDPVLRNRTVQNIRDFVRNRGLKNKQVS
ncbi:hypothetical protein N1851_019269 [Merluccius polli]|uniref:Uncharacterized protein n=1 Tax=Merluccius polli TaxID=89951 RepID=A0AA47MMJ2_MERPO|nr:hypothetical protein N1851_024943 [Merluccius polli]KAK0142796.1 hypothetical protein N1851_019269 [Merluccius polli]